MKQSSSWAMAITAGWQEADWVPSIVVTLVTDIPIGLGSLVILRAFNSLLMVSSSSQVEMPIDPVQPTIAERKLKLNIVPESRGAKSICSIGSELTIQNTFGEISTYLIEPELWRIEPELRQISRNNREL
ncbi:hypothetical protein BpHYR1_021113 [Brachionus plicatilis]|uniref:Uncharacterized protein n=1 Tax=Brachionus plicatilis TaxID=10195 RepID=A0A3M7SEC7_BRAPC|nr:hypothetical protein BpHYR1_021113 [Brachionus plicatilis]